MLLSLLLLQGFAGHVASAHGHLHEKKGLHARHNPYKARTDQASERIRKAQVDGRAPPKKQHNRRAASLTYTAPTTTSVSASTLASQTPTSSSSTNATPTSRSSSSSSSSSSTSPRSTDSSTATSSSSAPAPTETEVDESVGVGQQKLGDQCGGLLYFGQRGCVRGLTCMKANNWYSYCRSSCANGYGDVCGGVLYWGPTCCPAPQECKRSNLLWRSCQ